MLGRLTAFLESPASATGRLVAYAGLSVLVYARAFAGLASLAEAPPGAMPHFFHWFEAWSPAHLATVLAFVALGVLYALALQAARQARHPAAWAVVFGGSLACGAVLLGLFPYDAADIFDYILHGRMSALYAANPYRSVPNDFPQDPFYPYVAWKDERSPYGPLWGLLAALASSLAGDGLVANVVGYKLIPGLFLAASIWVVAQVLRREAPERALSSTLLLAWNPVVLYETWGNGHNDAVMVFWMIAAVWASSRRRHTLAVLALTAGALVKFLPLLLLPSALAIVLRDLPQGRPRAAFLARTAAGAALLAGLLYAPFWEGPQVLTVLTRGNLFTSSLPASAYALFQAGLGRELAAALVRRAALALTLAAALWQAFRPGKRAPGEDLAQSSFNVLAFYLLATCLWFQQWYTLWLIGLAPFLRWREARRLAVIFGFTALSKQFLAGPLVFVPTGRLPQPWFEIVFTLGVLGAAWLYGLYALRQARLQPGRARSYPLEAPPSGLGNAQRAAAPPAAAAGRPEGEPRRPGAIEGRR